MSGLSTSPDLKGGHDRAAIPSGRPAGTSPTRTSRSRHQDGTVRAILILASMMLALPYSFSVAMYVDAVTALMIAGGAAALLNFGGLHVYPPMVLGAILPVVPLITAYWLVTRRCRCRPGFLDIVVVCGSYWLLYALWMLGAAIAG